MGFQWVPRWVCLCVVMVGCVVGTGLGGWGCKTIDPETPSGEIMSPEAIKRLMPVMPASSRPTTSVSEPVFVDVGEKTTLIYSCRQSQPEELATAIEGLISPEGSLQPNASLNMLVVTDRPEVVRGIAKVLLELDREVSQLLVEARIVEVTVNDDLETEIRNRLTTPGGDSFFQNGDVTLNTPGSSPTVGQGSNINARLFSPGDYALDSFVRLLLTRGRAKILSSPNLLVSAGNEASIITGQEVPVQSATAAGNTSNITTQFKRVGIKLRVRLLQVTNDTARIELNPEVSAVTGFVNSGTTGSGDTGQLISNPIIAIRNVTSTLSLKDGEVLTVGGLLSTEDRDTIRGVPGLMDLPLAGNLFKATRKQRTRTQLIFFLRVHLLEPGRTNGVRVHTPDSALKIIDEAGKGESKTGGKPEAKP